ncbi:cell wall-active antibiotics response protein LiaF [Terrilactibacillus laevilacticus]|uniref:cell wall-active antibiotics response protein LiaF n=1 Tax=Terrilactibacillus laevilacticus TaxID=1380157 RepID=UPI00114686CA|nr:cell wall-active antibiotics response protein LiaF [Terrilactibacillus laevilacticus]
MIERIRTDFFSWMFMIAVILLFVQVIFFDWHSLFLLLLFTGCIFYGRKRLHDNRGKFLFGVGWVGIIITMINMAAFKFLLFVILIYFVYLFLKSKKEPNLLSPTVKETDPNRIMNRPLHKRTTLLKNMLFGKQTTDQIYEWDDINIQAGIGDTIIDLSNTILPNCESVISIRHFVGNIQILVPYDIEISINHSAMAGRAQIFQHQEPRLLNETVAFQTEGYEDSKQRMKIITSMVAGNLEVKHI